VFRMRNCARWALHFATQSIACPLRNCGLPDAGRV